MSTIKRATIRVNVVDTLVGVYRIQTINGSNVITHLADVQYIIPGLIVSGTGIPVGSYVVSISGFDVTISNNAIADGIVDATYTCPPNKRLIFDSTFFDVTGYVPLGDVVAGWLIYTVDVDPDTAMIIPGIFHRYKITEIIDKDYDSNRMSAYIIWDEGGNEEHMPYPSLLYAISEDDISNDLSALVSGDIYNDLPIGSAEGQYSADVNKIGAGSTGLLNIGDEYGYPGYEPVELMWNRTREALFIGVTGVGGHWIQVGSGSLSGGTGFIGETGAGGQTGIQGDTGAQGAAGAPGETGLAGVGETGIQGDTGAPGIGETGLPGFTGVQGETGLVGETGTQGIPGQTGIGQDGAQGTTGVQGPTGLIGLTGAGATGVQGATGIGAGKGMNLRYTHDAGAPSGGTRYLRIGQGVLSSECGDRIPVASTLTTVTIEVSVIDASRAYNLEIISDPTGAPDVLTTLNLPINTRGVTATGLSVAILANTEIGARLVRSAGAGSSTFNAVIANIVLMQ